MEFRGLQSLAAASLLVFALPVGAAEPAGQLERCLGGRDLPRVARVQLPDGRMVYARVTADSEGVPTAAVPIADADLDLAAVFERASQRALYDDAASFAIGSEELEPRLCAPVRLPQDEIDAEQRMVVAAGVNYAAHAKEAGGGDVFLFPKPAAPTFAYGRLAPRPGVELLDYEVELGFVLLADVNLSRLPSRDELLSRTAFFVANDFTDREPIIVHAALTGPATGFVEAKGQPGFLPVGPWMVRGSELFEALAACGADGLGIRLAVDEGDGFQARQDESTAAMILPPLALLAKLADEVARKGLRSPMPVLRDGRTRHYPLAVDAAAPRLPAGSIVLTGTPAGVAIQAPSPLALAGRALLNLRGPFEQFRQEELARAAAPGGYLAPGDRVRASIDGLGTQIIRIGEPSANAAADPCGGT